MLALFKDERDLARLERSGRLFRRRFLQQVFAVAATDLGDRLAYVSAEKVAAQGYASAAAAWAQVQDNFASRVETLSFFGQAPFWFVDFPGWPPSALLMWAGLHGWAQQALETDRPLMAASFSADQLIIGLADSAEFHDRLTHAREAPAQQPLFALPFLLQAEALPLGIAQVNLAIGRQVRLAFHDSNHHPRDLLLKED